MALDLYVVRHGGTAWTHTGQHTGRTDLPLLPEGERDARRVGEHLRGRPFAAVFSSDRRRALSTAELAGFPDPTVTPLLREWDYGDYEGRTSDEIWRERPGWEIFRDGCPGGEAPAQVYDRASRFLGLLDGLEGAALAFSHGHLLRTLGTAWTRLDVAAGSHLALDPAAICVLRAGVRGRLLQLWNWRPTLPLPPRGGGGAVSGRRGGSGTSE